MNNATQNLPEDEALASKARSLVTRAYASYHSYYGLCTTSCQVYDTAWVAMIPKNAGHLEQWLFPECFYYLLKSQSDDGSWDAHPKTQTAGILNTAAALLALLVHAKNPLQIADISSVEINERIERGLASLHKQLGGWDDVEQTNHVGVELILPALLSYLRKEDSSLSFEFPCKGVLDSMHRAKMALFQLEKLYGKKPSSMLYSLEAFMGEIDFDRVSHHIYRGSMMASPSSTAAYLIGGSKWDKEAELYLEHVVKAGSGHGDGGIPGIYPTTHFECSWILATLVQSGFSRRELECDGLRGLTNILYEAFENEGGIIGYAPRTADVDDTAKGLLALSLLNRHFSADTMIKSFEGRSHFTTIELERDPSLTSNLHVLLCLLHQPDSSQYHSQILKTAAFICQWWWDTDYRVKDKWHLSHLYPTMLLVEAFTGLLKFIDSDGHSGIIDENMQCRISVSLFQACLHIMLDQRDDGSWDGYREETCYAMLALAQARGVCFFNDIRAELQSCIDRGASWLTSCSLQSEERCWTSKTAFKLAFLAEAYKLAALKAALPNNTPGKIGHTLNFACISADGEFYMRLIGKTALFSSLDQWQVRASMIESSFFVHLLQAQRLEIYHRADAILAEDKYLTFISFSMVGCNNRSRTFASTSWLYDIMILAMLSYQTDKFMEAIAAPVFGETSILHRVIDNIFDKVIKVSSGSKNGSNSDATRVNADEKTTGQRNVQHPNISLVPWEVQIPLTRFISYIVNHEGILRSSSWDRENLIHEFRAYMHAHATRLDDNARFKKQENREVFASSTQSYFEWVRTTGGYDVACAYSLAFSNCLISASLGGGKEVFPTLTQKYLATAVMRHLTTMCRMYNDSGSTVRDSAECKINSINFPEFSSCEEMSKEGAVAKKQELARLAVYEHECLIQALKMLDRECQRTCGKTSRDYIDVRKLAILRLFCDVTDLCDQVYVIKDLSSSLKQTRVTDSGS